MKIQSIINQHRRDFRAFYECEGCGGITNSIGYDDRHFHEHVIPNMKCEKCGKSAVELGVKIMPRGTKYPEGMTV